jgi:hypothetical protein
MLAPTFPEWLPPTVADEAQRLLATHEIVDADLVLRLATDARMQSVWRHLLKHRHFPNRPRISDSLRVIVSDTTLIPPSDHLSDQEVALTLFFWCAYVFAFLKPTVSTVSRHDVAIANCRLEAARLRLSAARLRGLYLIPSDEHQFLPPDISNQAADGEAYFVEQAAKFCDEIEAALIKLKVAEAPLIVDRDHGHNEARGYIGLLAVETRKLFGSTLVGTLKKVASVALEKEITDKQAENWSRPPNKYPKASRLLGPQ